MILHLYTNAQHVEREQLTEYLFNKKKTYIYEAYGLSLKKAYLVHKNVKIYQVHNNVAYINIRSSQTISRLGNIVSTHIGFIR